MENVWKLVFDSKKNIDNFLGYSNISVLDEKEFIKIPDWFEKIKSLLDWFENYEWIRIHKNWNKIVRTPIIKWWKDFLDLSWNYKFLKDINIEEITLEWMNNIGWKIFFIIDFLNNWDKIVKLYILDEWKKNINIISWNVKNKVWNSIN